MFYQILTRLTWIGGAHMSFKQTNESVLEIVY